MRCLPTVSRFGEDAVSTSTAGTTGYPSTEMYQTKTRRN